MLLTHVPDKHVLCQKHYGFTMLSIFVMVFTYMISIIYFTVEVLNVLFVIVFNSFVLKLVNKIPLALKSRKSLKQVIINNHKKYKFLLVVDYIIIK